MKIMKVELEDLEEDLLLLISLYKEREEKHEITHYASVENFTVLANELTGLKDIFNSFDHFPLSEYQEIKPLADDLEILLKKRIKEAQLPEAVYDIVRRKLNKVINYVEEN
jgi:hypothetical protein